MNISKATRNNWIRLGFNGADRLTSRANKSRSERIVLSMGFAKCDIAAHLMKQIAALQTPLADAVFTLCLLQMEQAGISDAIINKFRSEYTGKYRFSDNLHKAVRLRLHCENDPIGTVYQSLTKEGIRNQKGQYYTSKVIVDKMLCNVKVNKGETFLDPCCGTGAFLLRTECDFPEQLFGIDTDETAVMICKANLLSKYVGRDFYPRIYLCDFLSEDYSASDDLPQHFDYIFTNPPWGISREKDYHALSFSSNERAALFVERSISRLKQGGEMGFLLPSSLLKIKAHGTWRHFLLQRTTLHKIHLLKERFCGVFTDVFFFTASNRPAGEEQHYEVEENGMKKNCRCHVAVLQPPYLIPLLSETEQIILQKMEDRRHSDLSQSTWGLGIVTGDNKGKLHSCAGQKTEPIITGKEIRAYQAEKPKKHIIYDRRQLQQCAKESAYRAEEKLIYKFISRTLVFAYDNRQQLVLNSANIVIPKMEGLSMKTVLAFLNSELYSFAYLKMFRDLKILKGNLCRLPFPKLTAAENLQLEQLVSDILAGNTALEDTVNQTVYRLFGITADEIDYIRETLYEKKKKSPNAFVYALDTQKAKTRQIRIQA